MLYRQFHENLFDKDHVNGVQGALAALRRPVPTIADYPNYAALEYADVAIRSHMQVAPQRRLAPALVRNGFRLLVLERIFEARMLPIPLGMKVTLRDIKLNAHVVNVLIRAGLMVW